MSHEQSSAAGVRRGTYELTGRVALVTGAGRSAGIGAGIARRLAHEGAVVAITDLCRQEGDRAAEEHRRRELREVERELAEIRPESFAVEGDIRVERDVEAIVAAVLTRCGRIDILVNNAGVAVVKPVPELSAAEFRLCMDVIALGTFLCSSVAARHMIERGQGGRIINIASANGKVGAPLLTAYCAAKFAVMGITQSMAHDLARHQINVNAVCPGPTNTPHLAEAQVARAARLGVSYDEQYLRTAASIPWGRHGRPEDVAAAVAFLASDEADFITGHGLNVDGGWLMAR